MLANAIRWQGPQRGVALITAMLVVALVTILAVGMMSRQQFSIRQTANLLHSEQARLYHMAVEDHATPLLQQYWEQLEFLTLEEYQRFSLLAGMGYQEVVEGGQLAADITFGAQGQFNVNNLVRDGVADPEQVLILRRLLQHLELSPSLADAVVDWLDQDDETTGFDGAEDNYYLGADPPYRCANQPMVDLSELRLVKGFDSETLQTLQPFVTVLPPHSSINVNWASAELIQALHVGLDGGVVAAMLESRAEAPFKSVEQFVQQQPLTSSSVELPPTGLSVSNDYFELHTVIQVGRVTRRFRTLLHRNNEGEAEIVMRNQEQL